MDDEFKLCWKNFQDNIASGFQNLYDRGDLVDVTLACDGKLLHAHKIVLAICSPYFQEIFITNPCKHPIIILKDVTFNIMCELLEFMYQGVVNVKHTELQSFMKIGQLLQIKGLATNASSSAASSSSEKSASQIHHPEDTTSACGDALSNSATTKGNPTANAGDSSNTDGLASSKLTSLVSVKSHSPASSPSPMAFGASLNQQAFKSSPDNNTPTHHSYHAVGSGSGSGGGSSSLKRHIDLNSDALSVYSRKQYRRSIPSVEHSGEHSDSAEGAGLDSVNAEDYFLSSIPHIASNTSAAAAAAAATLRSTFNPAAFGFDYNMYKNSSSGGGLGVGGSGGGGGGGGPNSSGPDYPNDLHMPNDYSKGYANHMDIPPIAPGEHWFHGKLEFMLSQRGKPLLVHDGHTFGIQYVRKDKKYWQCNLSRKFNCKARVTTTDTGEIIVTNNEHCHTEIRQHLRKDYQRNKVMMNALINLSTKSLAENLRRHNSSSLSSLNNFQSMVSHGGSSHNSHTASSTPTVGTNLSAHSLSPHFGSPEQLSSIDFTKTGATGTTSPPRTHHRDDAAEDDDNVTPLDCGLRSTVVDATGKMNNTDNGGLNTPSSSDWKCKNELADAQ